MKKLIATLMVVSAFGTYASAAQKKALKDVDVDAFTSDTQVAPRGTGDDHMALAWWIPHEFWESMMSRDTTTSETDKRAMLDAMSGVSLMAVVQADISAFGAFDFYSKEEVERNMSISFATADGKKRELAPLKEIGSDLKVVLGIFKPILEAAMGNMGNNLHFFVLDDETESSPRIIDPYRQGQIDIQLTRRNEVVMTASIEMPLNSLFVPRKCPNGKEAHVSWKYCPWTGKRLED